ncbi:hypothetical protein CRE_28269 [Caenorhabditis remanei]|uniref:F-box domain-containing protein n=1 Tax=Caenorhabditis remanei TaxID=31234 RepID=E3LN21_CAERE|nr:hypothetical protein CRE_28269 [Caenorhabditis remanei]
MSSRADELIDQFLLFLRQSNTTFKPFPLLSLPPEIINRSLQQFNCVDLIDFALCSKRCKKTVQKMNHGVKSIELSIIESNSSIILKSQNGILGFVDFESSIPDGIIRSRYINSKEVFVCKTDLFYYCRDLKWIPIKLMYRFLSEIFAAPIHVLFNPVQYSNFQWFFNEIRGEQFESLIISGPNPIPPPILTCLMNDVKANGSFVLNVRHNGVFYPPELPSFFDVDYLEMLDTAEWMTKDIFLSLYCRRMRISFCHLKNRDFEQFVTQWYFSNNTRLQYVEVWFKVTPGLMNFKHFQLHRWDPYRRAQFYNSTPHLVLNCSTGFDIIRKDGTVATILIFSGSFHFIVWKDRFPPYGGSILNLV